MDDSYYDGMINQEWIDRQNEIEEQIINEEDIF